ncbi:SIR2 family protein [Curtobacterium sp. MCPF17_021]|uniref:SIR2 family protein n=1 Tax=Curtobacterium sp. MCPF17_021 TaxID=2175639 RepID=UPI0015E8C25F|nr:SIR2 family protein [Curtobacterium sp. MCPF17_021]WIE85094.1 SIR2 family protein [Curtobacterium sp. MCPF17_021]
MRELVDAVSEGDIDLGPLSRFGNDLEQWMSFLSVDQPWLSAADNYANRSTFLRLSDQINKQIMDAEERAVASTPPEWLIRFVWEMSDREASLFTFNYDTLLERGLSLLRRTSTWADLYGAPLSTRTAPSSGLVLGPDEPKGLIPMIYKLHGSINWSFSGLEGPPNDPIVMTSEGRRWDAVHQPLRQQAPRYQHLYDDLVPLIVPPTYSKGPYFFNRSLRAQWAAGAQALQSADELIVAGYSFPEGDLVARQWVASSVRSPSVTVINPDERAAQKMDDLLGSRGDITHFSSVSNFVDAHCPSLVRWEVYVHDRLGLQVELLVDGVDMTAGIDRMDPPWDRFDETAVEWVNSFLDWVDPRIREQAVQMPLEDSVRVSAFSAIARSRRRFTREDVSRFTL